MKLPFFGMVRLRPSILTMFVLLTVPVFSTIVAANYLTSQSIARESAAKLVERFRIDAIESIEDAIHPVNSMVHNAAVLGAEQPEFYSQDASSSYLLSMLRHSHTIIATYVGLADGSFRQARRLSGELKVRRQPRRRKAPNSPIAGSIRRADRRRSLDRYIFLDQTGKVLGTAAEPTRYDPRQRYWYEQAASKRDLTISDPEPFAVSNLIGITVAAPFYSGGAIAGVTAADIALDGLSKYLSTHKISPGTLSYLLDKSGGVIANSERARTYDNDSGRVELQHITLLDDDLPGIAFSRARHKEGLSSFSYDGREYIASLTGFPPEFSKPWHLFTITPLRDFSGPLTVNNQRLLAFGVVAIALEILIIYFLSAVIARPLEKLALKVTRIQDFRRDEMPPVVSRVQEVAVLSHAIETLATTIKSFAAFVPVGLVKQLINSDQTLTLGGHSRFLTIFFSDLEAFSTLSEEVPSHELMSRLSAYLQLVTNSVNEELGTIDKFIGDGVMAFWGAPALLDDHAWRACVAALRIDRGMKALNARWATEGLKPLNLRIGMHSNSVIVGNIGSTERMGYTVIGDGVNIAARLEAINKEYGTRMCISHSVYRETGERLCVRPIDEVAVKGRRTKIAIYELLGAFGAGTATGARTRKRYACRG